MKTTKPITPGSALIALALGVFGTTGCKSDPPGDDSDAGTPGNTAGGGRGGNATGGQGGDSVGGNSSDNDAGPGSEGGASNGFDGSVTPGQGGGATESGELELGIELFHNTERDEIRGAEAGSIPIVIDAETSSLGSEVLRDIEIQIDSQDNLYVLPTAQVFAPLAWSGSGFDGLFVSSLVKYSPDGTRQWGEQFSRLGIPKCSFCSTSDREAFEQRPDFELLPAFDYADEVATLRVATDGSVFFGGIMAGTEETPTAVVAGGGALVGKLDSDGFLNWYDQVMSEDGEEAFVTWIGFGSEGSLLAYGACAGLMPDQTTESTGGRFIIRYDADGEREWIKQYPPEDFIFDDEVPREPQNPFVAGADGDLYVPIGASAWTGQRYYVYGGGLGSVLGALRTIDTNGVLANETLRRASGFDMSPAVPEPVLAPTGDAFYAIGDVAALYQEGDLADHQYLIRETLDGSESWTREIEFYQQGIAQVLKILSSEDALYLFGRTGTRANVFVMRLDLEGERVWFQELQLPDSALTHRPSMALGADGQVAVAFVTNPPPTEILEELHLVLLDSEDGSVR